MSDRDTFALWYCDLKALQKASHKPEIYDKVVKAAKTRLMKLYKRDEHLLISH